MADKVNIEVHPYGLGGGVFLSGSASASLDGFMYYPVTNTTAIVKMNSTITNGSSMAISASAGVPIYGPITSVTQSSGIAFVYNGVSYNPPRL